MVDQACAIPYRRTDAGLEVLLVTARSDGSWIAPKGSIERGEDAAAAAAREALEEAGVEGDVLEPELGEYTYRKFGEKRLLIVFALEVTNAHPEWDESHQRERRWTTIDEARDLVEADQLVEMLDRLAERLRAPASNRRN